MNENTIAALKKAKWAPEPGMLVRASGMDLYVRITYVGVHGVQGATPACQWQGDVDELLYPILDDWATRQLIAAQVARAVDLDPSDGVQWLSAFGGQAWELRAGRETCTFCLGINTPIQKHVFALHGVTDSLEALAVVLAHFCPREVELKAGQVWEHYKGSRYGIFGFCQSQDDGQRLVLYGDYTGEGEGVTLAYARTEKNFRGLAPTGAPRFKLVSE